MTQHIVIVGAGIVGISTGIWLRRFGVDVTVIDRGAPGQGTSYGNAGLLAACAMVPVTGPGLLRKATRMLLNPEFPLFLRWGYLPRLLPWLLRYMSHANDADTRRIARDLTPIVADSLQQHQALTAGTGLEHWVTESEYHFAYADRAAFEADSYAWGLRRDNGFTPVLREGAQVQAHEPSLGPAVQCLATMKDHGFIRDPGGYVAALAAHLQKMGGQIRQAEVTDFDLTDGHITAVLTGDGPVTCDRAILCSGVWSKPLMAKLGLNIPLESERGYHIVFRGARGIPNAPTMVAAGKFVATPMAAGLRCAGVVEFGGLDAGPSKAPLDLLRRQVKRALPGLEYDDTEEWLGHRPAPSDSLPLIGEIGQTGILTAFGHHHIGLTGGPKTGRMVAEMLTRRHPNTDPAPYSPERFRSA